MIMKNVLDYYSIYSIEGNQVIHVCSIMNRELDFHHIRKINSECLLLSSARCWFHSKDDIEKNALIINRNGEVLNQFTLGDGIQDIKIEKEEIIWTSYFDEGVFGNYGWIEPLGASGLRSWSLEGEPIYEYDAEDYDYSISDCYAFNIDENSRKWFYFYTEFYLCELSGEQKKYYTLDVGGASVLAIDRDCIITDCGYQKRDQFALHRRNEDNYQIVETFKIIDVVSSEGIDIKRIQFCEDQVVILSEDSIYRFKVGEIKTEFNVM